MDLIPGEIEKLRLQKLLFMYAVKMKKPVYEFVPYKFGCYSYSAKADLNTMVKKSFLSESNKGYTKIDDTKYFDSLKEEDQKLLQSTVSDYGSMTTNQLIKHTYINYPFYAINSTIVKEILPKTLLNRVSEAQPKEMTPCLFTIGYEGVSLEAYLLKLIKNNVKLLVDVRKNPLSMKFGFSKTLLKKFTANVGIEYIHIPEVGIESSKRKSLETQKDYDTLFKDYVATTLKDSVPSQNQILNLLQEHKRIALTCFEAESCQCHRSHLANSIGNLPNFTVNIQHI